MGDGAKVEDSNMALVGSDEDHEARKASALTEEAWQGAGTEEGLLIWRIEKFQVKPWPKDMYGKFYRGDSYILLKTVKSEAEFIHDIFFWIGSQSSQDEYGSAAYKSVELDAFFDGEPTIHRVTEHKESKAFRALFHGGCIQHLDGGIETGFRHVEDKSTFEPKLLQVKRSAEFHAVNVTEVPRVVASLNNGDCFVLDAGKEIMTWYGAHSSPFEKNAANTFAENTENERDGHSKAMDFGDAEDKFWDLLGGKGDVADGPEARDFQPPGDSVLFKFVDGAFVEVAREGLSTSMLESSSVFMLETEGSLLVWLGQDSGAFKCKHKVIEAASNFVKTTGRSEHTQIVTLREGREGRVPEWINVLSS